MDKNTSADLVKDLNNKPPHLLAYVNYKERVDYKIKMGELTRILGRLNIFLNLKAVRGLLLIKVILDKIEISKIIFVETMT